MAKPKALGSSPGLPLMAEMSDWRGTCLTSPLLRLPQEPHGVLLPHLFQIMLPLQPSNQVRRTAHGPEPMLTSNSSVVPWCERRQPK